MDGPLNPAPRRARVERQTKETKVVVELELDGSGVATINTGIGFFNHMLILFATHGRFDLTIRAQGDLEVDTHHTVEDVGICLGMSLKESLGNRSGIKRYGSSVVPMDEARAAVYIDLSNRPYLVYDTVSLAPRIGQFETETLPEFFRAFCTHGGVTLHIEALKGSNTHHIIEATFKALGRALR